MLETLCVSLIESAKLNLLLNECLESFWDSVFGSLCNVSRELLVCLVTMYSEVYVIYVRSAVCFAYRICQIKFVTE